MLLAPRLSHLEEEKEKKEEEEEERGNNRQLIYGSIFPRGWSEQRE